MWSWKLLCRFEDKKCVVFPFFVEENLNSLFSLALSWASQPIKSEERQPKPAGHLAFWGLVDSDVTCNESKVLPFLLLLLLLYSIACPPSPKGFVGFGRTNKNKHCRREQCARRCLYCMCAFDTLVLMLFILVVCLLTLSFPLLPMPLVRCVCVCVGMSPAVIWWHTRPTAWSFLPHGTSNKNGSAQQSTYWANSCLAHILGCCYFCAQQWWWCVYGGAKVRVSVALRAILIALAYVVSFFSPSKRF